MAPLDPHESPFPSLRSPGRGPPEDPVRLQAPLPHPQRQLSLFIGVGGGVGWEEGWWSQQPTLLEPRTHPARGRALAWARASLQPCKHPLQGGSLQIQPDRESASV